MTRREFLAATSTVALAARSASPNDQIVVGMIGLGGRGRALLQKLLTLKDVRIGYLCDPDQSALERAEAILREQSAPAARTTTDMRRIFEDPEVHAVFIATPDHWHAPATILACEAGKDVYVEKPASHNIREGRLMIEAARRTGRIVQVGMQSRSRPCVLRAIEFVRSGKIGKVLMAKAWNVQLRRNIGHKPDGPVPPGVDYEMWLGPAPWIPFNENRFHYNWHWHWHFGTGDAGNDGVHQIDIARWALGVDYPLKASGMGRKIFFDDDQQTPDTMNVTFEYTDKAMIWEMRIWNPYGMEGVDNGVAIYGTEGMVQIGRWDRRWGYKVFDRKGTLVFHDDRNEPDEHVENFLSCVRSRKTPNADILDGHLSALHAHLANIVARVGRNVTFDPETETIPNDPEANRLTRRVYREHWATPKDPMCSCV